MKQKIIKNIFSFNNKIIFYCFQNFLIQKKNLYIYIYIYYNLASDYILLPLYLNKNSSLIYITTTTYIDKNTLLISYKNIYKKI